MEGHIFVFDNSISIIPSIASPVWICFWAIPILLGVREKNME
jgi:hypothetical protein